MKKVSVKEAEKVDRAVAVAYDKAITLIDLFGEEEAEEYQEDFIFPLEDALGGLITLVKKLKD